MIQNAGNAVDSVKNEFDSVTDIVFDKLGDWIEVLIEMLPNLIVAVLVAVLFGILTRITKRLLLKLLNKISDNLAVNKFIANITAIAVLLLGIFIALDVLKLDKTVTSLLAGAGIIGLALSFAFQDLATNFISGVMIASRRPIKVGEIVEIADYFGKVESISLRDSVLRTPTGQMVIIPNKEIYQNPIENYSRSKLRRIDLGVGISYGDDLEKVEEVTIKAVKTLERIKHEKGIDFFYEEFGDSSINFVVRFWVDYFKQLDYLGARSDAIKAIKAAYEENDITIPFPIRTLDFGIKGGEKLSDNLNKS